MKGKLLKLGTFWGVVGCLACCSLVVGGMNWLYSAHRDIPLDKLLIDASAFPDGFYVSYGPVPRRQADGEIVAVDTRVISFSAPSPSQAGAGESLYLNSNKWAAAAEYRDQLKIKVNSSSIASVTPWKAPDTLSYQSSVANQSYFACHINAIIQREVCKYLAQYDEYLVIFSARTEQGTFEYDDIRRVLEAIDARMAQYLSAEK